MEGGKWGKRMMGEFWIDVRGQQAHSFAPCEHIRDAELDNTSRTLALLAQQRRCDSKLATRTHLDKFLSVQLAPTRDLYALRHSSLAMSNDGASRGTGVTGFSGFRDMGADADGVAAECRRMWMTGEAARRGWHKDRKKTGTRPDRTDVQPDHRLRLHDFRTKPGCGCIFLRAFLQPSKDRLRPVFTATDLERLPSSQQPPSSPSPSLLRFRRRFPHLSTSPSCPGGRRRVAAAPLAVMVESDIAPSAWLNRRRRLAMLAACCAGVVGMPAASRSCWWGAGGGWNLVGLAAFSRMWLSLMPSSSGDEGEVIDDYERQQDGDNDDNNKMTATTVRRQRQRRDLGCDTTTSRRHNTTTTGPNDDAT
ncbi:hypothetical protein EDB85DRAFT_1891770 [Lactarius pseudohatsudake]|nr:hypothetical protein EDB85DRAFT_1891770 [Lactarius pseudohatsudake]